MGKKAKIRQRLSPAERESRLQTVRRAAEAMHFDYEAEGMTEEDLLAMYEKVLQFAREGKQEDYLPDNEASGETLHSMPSSYIRRVGKSG